MTDQTPPAPAAAPLHPALPPSERALLNWADKAMETGSVPVERVKQALAEAGIDEEMIDQRSKAQRDHDAAYGIKPYVLPSDYAVRAPASVAPISEGHVKFDNDARELASDLGLQPGVANSLIASISQAANELDTAADPAQLKLAWQAQLVSLFPGEKLAEARAQIDALLQEFTAADSRLVTRLREHGALDNPRIFMALRNRALTIAAWKANRPA